MFVGGGVVIGVGTRLFQYTMISPEVWIIWVGVGVSLSTTPFTGSLFDRIVACTRTKGTAVFLVFFADGISYLGVLILLLYKTSRSSNNNETSSRGNFELFLQGCHVFTVVLILTGTVSAVYWKMVTKWVQDGGTYYVPVVEVEVVTDDDDDDDVDSSANGCEITTTIDTNTTTNSSVVAAMLSPRSFEMKLHPRTKGEDT